MFNRYFGAVVVLLLFASMSSGQADQASNAEKQKAADGQTKEAPKKENAGDAIAAMMGGAHIDKEAAERGRKIFVPALLSKMGALSGGCLLSRRFPPTRLPTSQSFCIR